MGVFECLSVVWVFASVTRARRGTGNGQRAATPTEHSADSLFIPSIEIPTDSIPIDLFSLFVSNTITTIFYITLSYYTTTLNFHYFH